MTLIPFHTREPAAWGAMPGRGRQQATRASHDTHLARAYSMQGLPIPKLAQGVAPFDGNVIWLKREPSDAEGNKVVSFAAVYAVGEVFIGAVFAGGKLVWGAPEWSFIENNEIIGGAPRLNDPAVPMMKYPGASIRTYHGTTPQTPDPAIVADKGAARVDGWPGYVVVVFEKFPLKDFGNRIPPTVAWLTETGFVGDQSISETTSTRSLEPPAFLSRDGLEIFGVGATGANRRAVAVMSRATIATREVTEWTLPSPTYGVQQTADLDGAPGPVTYWPSESLWPRPWPIAMDDEERAYLLEVFESVNWASEDRGPLIGTGNNEGRWERSPTKFRVVRVDPRTGARLSTSGFFRSPTEGEEYWWRPITGVGTVVANPDQGRAALQRVQMMTCERGREQYLYVLFTSFPEDNDDLHIYWREPQVDTSTPPPFTAPSGPYNDPGELTHLPGSGRTDIRASVVVFKLPDLSVIHATVDLGAKDVIPTGLARGPEGTIYVLGATEAHRRYETPPAGRVASVCWLAGGTVRGAWDLEGVTVTDNSTHTDVFAPEGSASSTELARNLTEPPWPMSGFYDDATVALYALANRRPMWPGDYVAAFPRKITYTGTLYKFSLPGMAAAGSLDRIPVEQATQIMAGPDEGRIWLRGDFDTHQETSAGVYTVLTAGSRIDEYHDVDLSDLSLHKTVDYGEVKATNITPQSFKMWSNDFLYDQRRLMHSFMGRPA